MKKTSVPFDAAAVVDKARRSLINQVAHRRASRRYEEERHALAAELDSAERYGRGNELLSAWKRELVR